MPVRWAAAGTAARAVRTSLMAGTAATAALWESPDKAEQAEPKAASEPAASAAVPVARVFSQPPVATEVTAVLAGTRPLPRRELPVVTAARAAPAALTGTGAPEAGVAVGPTERTGPTDRWQGNRAPAAATAEEVDTEVGVVPVVGSQATPARAARAAPEVAAATAGRVQVALMEPFRTQMATLEAQAVRVARAAQAALAARPDW